MAEVSNGRARFGRFLTAIGFVWFFWALFGRLISVELGTTPLDLPILPGFVILFLGRALTRGARSPAGGRGAAESPQAPPAEHKAQRPPPVVAPPPRPRQVELPEVFEADEPVLVDQATPGEGERVAEEVSMEPQQRMTSAEMVAQARKRFGQRWD